MKQKISKNIKTVISILQDEVKGDYKKALKKVHEDYSMTWMYKSMGGKLFPRTGRNIKKEFKEVYLIKDRKYDLKNIAEGQTVVMVEMVESYPNPKTKKVFRTPLVIVLEMKKGKIKRGRHYCDPRVSYLYLPKKEIDRIFK